MAAKWWIQEANYPPEMLRITSDTLLFFLLQNQCFVSFLGSLDFAEGYRVVASINLTREEGRGVRYRQEVISAVASGIPKGYN